MLDVHNVQAEDVDMSWGQHNLQHWFLGEQNPQSKLNLKEDAGVQVYSHGWMTQDERAHACLRQTRVSPLLKNAWTKNCARWVRVSSQARDARV